jgi:hypothetical protein
MMSVSMTADHSALKDELAHFGVQVLSAGVLVQVALIPMVLYGEIESRTLAPTLLAVTYGLEAAFVFLMAIKLAQGRKRVLELWLSCRLTRAMQGVLCGPD